MSSSQGARHTEKQDKDDLFPIKPIPIFVGLGLFFTLLALPVPEGLSVEGWRVVAVAVLMITWWITEAIPIPATSLLPVALLPTLGATSGKNAGAPYGDPIIFLFLGGFILALAMERWNLHRRIALNIVSRTGSQQHMIIAGFMIATAFISMWVSNTATAVMMLPVALSVAKLLEGTGSSSKFPLALMLAIAYAASIGGVATLIGTPPNALLAGMLNQTYGYDLGFARWMIVGVPVMLIMLVGTWVVLTKVTIRLDTSEIPGADALFKSQIAELGNWSKPEIRVGIIFLLTASAWIFREPLSGFVPGLNDTSIAIFAALSLFLVPSGHKEGGALVDWKTANRLPWGVLVLFGGGLSLAAAVVSTGLDTWIGDQMGGMAQGLPLILVVMMITAVVLILTEFTSNTATGAAFIPLVAALAVGLGENPLLLTAPAALAASLAFMLPVATPPNAIVFGSGHVTIPQMAKNGALLNVLGLFAAGLVTYWLLLTFFGVTLGELPEWAARAPAAN